MRVIQRVQSPGNEPVDIVWSRNATPLGVVDCVASIMRATEEEPDRWTPTLLSVRVEVSEAVPTQPHVVHYASADEPGDFSPWSVYREEYASPNDDNSFIEGSQQWVSRHHDEATAQAEVRRLQAGANEPVTPVTKEELPGGPNRRCSACGNATINRREQPEADVFCAFCETALDQAMLADLQEETDWAIADPSALTNEEQKRLARATLRKQHARMLIHRVRS